MRTLYVSDLDGTLLNRKDRIGTESLRIINGLVEKGMLFTYATARSFSSASIVAQGLHVKLPVIVYNGGFITEPDTGKPLYSLFFTGEEAGYVQARLQKCGISPLVYACVDQKERVTWNGARENDGIRHYRESRAGDKRLRILPDDAGLYEGDIFYFNCIGDREELLPVYEIFAKDDRFRCTLQQELYRPEYFCEIMPKKASKAEAIGRLKEHLKCDRIVTFGDAINDIPMFEISDECYAVENAAEKLKEIATGVIGTNVQDGVAKWLEKNWKEYKWL